MKSTAWSHFAKTTGLYFAAKWHISSRTNKGKVKDGFPAF